MASVSSLDKDLRNMRLSKYTPQASNEVKEWIEEVLGDRLPQGDLLDALKDGVALCKLINLAVQPGVKYKSSSMPFVQMENISHFLRACQQPPLNLQPHDVFLTVDLYERKDPTQVIQCIGAFSRRASTLQPAAFKRSIGPQSRAAAASPLRGSNYTSPTSTSSSRARGLSRGSETSSTFDSTATRSTASSIEPNTTGGSHSSNTTANGVSTPRGKTSSWSRKSDEGVTAPAWNIHQYGYMGGASQGNQGIAFGARRQITSPSPKVPTLAEKERKRREEQAEQDRMRAEVEAAERQRKIEQEAEEERQQLAEEQRREEQSRKQRERERREAEEEKRRWEEEERRWKDEEERRLREERESEAAKKAERSGNNGRSDTQLRGQFLSQYQAEQDASADRVRQLELELEKAKERERQYEQERQENLSRQSRGRPDSQASSDPRPMRQDGRKATSRSRSRARGLGQQIHNEATLGGEEGYARAEGNGPPSTRPLPNPSDAQYHTRHPPNVGDPTKYEPPSSHTDARPLPEPVAAPVQLKTNTTGPSSRPLPDPAAYASNSNRTDRYLAQHPAPEQAKPRSHVPNELGFDSAAERHMEDSRREASQTKTKAGGWASKSLLEREMERERQRQQEWEEAQKVTQAAADSGVGRGLKEGTVGEGGSWDVNQYGWTGGDNQNRGGPGLALGGRRQIIGPRPPP
ncbi:MAG: hypothetical protein M1817_002287 [Caeruleum heppii]|nr:MAG: hypothetical protein M1817_003528 [Caeruleum heppii]KAI9673650.1 MAG: hypothetical protein M1817_002287 [Caeruleum heppii]